MSAEIYEMVVQFLHITYTVDAATEARLTNEINAGIEYLQKYYDSGATFEPGTAGGQLLCEYVLRAESGALETFAKDYAQDIMQGRNLAEVEGYAEAKGYAEDP